MPRGGASCCTSPSGSSTKTEMESTGNRQGSRSQREHSTPFRTTDSRWNLQYSITESVQLNQNAKSRMELINDHLLRKLEESLEQKNSNSSSIFLLITPNVHNCKTVFGSIQIRHVSRRCFKLKLSSRIEKQLQ